MKLDAIGVGVFGGVVIFLIYATVEMYLGGGMIAGISAVVAAIVLGEARARIKTAYFSWELAAGQTVSFVALAMLYCWLKFPWLMPEIMRWS